MSTKASPTASTVEDYLDLLQAFAEHGIEYVVIGGCAVGAYARQLGETVFSNDLDLLVTQSALDRVIMEASSLGVMVEKMPTPRSVPVALLAWRSREVNLLTSSHGLPQPDIEARSPIALEILRFHHQTPRLPRRTLAPECTRVYCTDIQCSSNHGSPFPTCEVEDQAVVTRRRLGGFARARSARQGLGAELADRAPLPDVR